MLVAVAGEYAAWKGTFWPTVISPSVLSVMTTCGVLMTLTSLELCSACSTIPNDGMLTPETVIGGPWMPARKPLRLDKEDTPPSELSPPSSLPSTPTSELRSAPPCSEAPKSVSSSRLTSMITASTKTWRRAMSSRSISLTRLRQSAWPAITTSEFVFLSAVIFTSPAAGVFLLPERDCSVAARSSAFAFSSV